MKATTFYDMHSGGSQKERFSLLIIEAPREEAIAVFYARFGHNPQRVSCTCCGEDYSVDEHESLDAAKAGYFARHTPYTVIPQNEITEEERKTDVPVEGYVWHE